MYKPIYIYTLHYIYNIYKPSIKSCINPWATEASQSSCPLHRSESPASSSPSVSIAVCHGKIHETSHWENGGFMEI